MNLIIIQSVRVSEILLSISIYSCASINNRASDNTFNILTRLLYNYKRLIYKTREIKNRHLGA